MRRVIKAGEAAEMKNLKIAADLQCRNSRNRQQLFQHIGDGELGDLHIIRAAAGSATASRSIPPRIETFDAS